MKSKRLFLWVLSSALIIILCFVSPVTGKTARDIAKKAFPSVVMLVMEDSAGQPLSLGSGFFVRNDIVATNLHVIEGAAGGYAKIVGAKPKYEVAGYVAIDKKSDLILLKIKDANAPVLRLGDSNKVAVGDEIFAVGNPRGLEGTFSKGIVSGIRKVGEDSLLQITAPISPGSSGGPVLNTEGHVIAVAVATFRGGQNLNFAIPVSYLSKLLSDLKPVKKLAAKEKPKQKVKSILDGLGGRNTEGVRITHINFARGLLGCTCTFSIHNKLNRPVYNVHYLFVFYDNGGEPIDYHEGVGASPKSVYVKGGWSQLTEERRKSLIVEILEDPGYSIPIRPGLAKRDPFAFFTFSDEIVEMMGCSLKDAVEQERVKVRILDFQILEESEETL